DEIAAENFRTVIGKVRPSIVHLHARSAAVSERLADIAHEAGAKVLFTYHTPAVSCARGSMMLFGRQPCDGVMERRRCSVCTLVGRGAPRPFAALVAAIPARLQNRLGSPRLNGGLFTALRMPHLIAGTHKRFRKLLAKVDHVVAVSQWVF